MTIPGQETMGRPRRFPWRTLLRVALAAALLGVIFFKADFRALGQALSGISLWYVLGAYLLYVVSLVFKAVRWQRLGVTHRHATVLDCFSATACAYLLGLAAPGMFEFTRAYVLKKRARVPFGSVFGIMVAERALDTVLLLSITFFVLVLVPGAEWLSGIAAVLAALVVAGLGLLVLFVSTRHRSVPKIERALSRLSPRAARAVAGFLEHTADGLHRLRELRAAGVCVTIGFSLLLWASRGLSILLVFRSLPALGLGAAFGIALFLGAVEYFGMLVRLTPGAIGQYEFLIVGVLVAFGVAKSLAAGAAIVLRGVRMVVIVSLGLPFLYREHIGASRIARERVAAGDDAGSLGARAPE